MNLTKWFKNTETEPQKEKVMVIEKELKSQELSITYDEIEVGRIVYMGGRWLFHTCAFYETGNPEQRTHLFTIDEMCTISLELNRISQKYPEGVK